METLKGILTNGWHSLDASFDLLWSKVSPVVLPLVLILIFLAVGLWLSGFISDKLGALIKKSKVDTLTDGLLSPVFKFTGTKVSASGVISLAIKWFLIATVIVAALDLANLGSVIDFFNQVLGYLPNIVIAALIIIVGSLVANLASYIVGIIYKNGKDNLTTIAKVAVNALAFIAALSQVATPVVNSFSQFIGQLSLSKLQADVLFIGIIVLVLLASKNAINKTIESWYKS
jgi:hypothetical protein